jgi:hypothetical protein
MMNRSLRRQEHAPAQRLRVRQRAQHRLHPLDRQVGLGEERQVAARLVLVQVVEERRVPRFQRRDVKQEIGFVALLESTGVQVADRADELAFVNVPELLQPAG